MDKEARVGLTGWPSPRKGPVANQGPALHDLGLRLRPVQPYPGLAPWELGSVGLRALLWFRQTRISVLPLGFTGWSPTSLWAPGGRRGSLARGLEGWTGTQALESEVRAQISVLTLNSHALDKPHNLLSLSALIWKMG